MGIDDVIVANAVFDRILKNKGNFHQALIKISNENHAPSIYLDDNEIYIVWFAGSEMGRGDVAIYFTNMKYNNDDNIFSEPKLIANISGYSCQNPVIFGNDNKLIVYFTAQPEINDAHYTQKYALIFRIESSDCGKSWSEKTLIINEKGFFIKSIPLLIGNKLYLPIYTDNINYDISSFLLPIEPSCKKIDVSNTSGLVQPCIIHINHKYQIYFRDRANEWIYKSVSLDGIGWDKAEQTSLKNNNSGICFTSFNNTILGIINPDRETRYPLILVSSHDEGNTWKKVMDLHEDFIQPYKEYCFDKFLPEFSYPSMLIKNNILHIVYTFCRGGISYVRVDNISNLI